MTCPTCKAPYKRIKTPQSAYLYKKQCSCRRVKTKPMRKAYTVRDAIRDEVRR